MSSPLSNVDTPAPLYPTLNTTTTSTNNSVSPPNSYVSLLDSRETPGEISYCIIKEKMKKYIKLDRWSCFIPTTTCDT